MRVRVWHETLYRYETPPSGVIQMLRATPRSHNGQYVVWWRTDVSANCRVSEQEDAFGNIVQTFCADGPLDTLRILVEGEVDTEDTNGFLNDVVERFPPELFLRMTDLTQADALIADTAGDLPAADPLETLHAILDAVHDRVKRVAGPDAVPSLPAATLAKGSGSASDIAHLFVALARAKGIPARYVSGYLAGDGDVSAAPHVWAEGHAGDLGWIGFDATTGFCPTGCHVRVAVGVDALSGSPVRGTHYGGGKETVHHRWNAEQAAGQTQS